MSKHDKPAKPKKATPTDHKDGLTFFSDGTVSAQAFEDYFKSYTGSGTLIHNFFFSDTDKVFHADPVQAGNIAYNRANVYGPLGQFLQGVGDMLQGFSCSLVDGRFDSHSVVGLPLTRASRQPVAGIPAIVAEWKAQGWYPLVLV
jgi:hypothetical protein